MAHPVRRGTAALRDFRSAYVGSGSKADRLAVNIFRLECPQEQTSSRHSGTSEKCQMYGPAVRYVWPGRAVQDGLPRSANVRAASMYQASEVEHLLLAIMGIRAHPGL